MQAEDYRHDTPPVPRNRVQFEGGAEEIRTDGDAHEDAVNEAAYNHGFQLPVRRPVSTHSLFSPPPPMPAFGTGLNWVASAQSPVRTDLVNYGFDLLDPHDNRPMVSNIELRTIYAHLLETAGRVRAEMRERGMQVDL